MLPKYSRLSWTRGVGPISKTPTRCRKSRCSGPAISQSGRDQLRGLAWQNPASSPDSLARLHCELEEVPFVHEHTQKGLDELYTGPIIHSRQYITSRQLTRARCGRRWYRIFVLFHAPRRARGRAFPPQQHDVNRATPRLSPRLSCPSSPRDRPLSANN